METETLTFTLTDSEGHTLANLEYWDMLAFLAKWGYALESDTGARKGYRASKPFADARLNYVMTYAKD